MAAGAMAAGLSGRGSRGLGAGSRLSLCYTGWPGHDVLRPTGQVSTGRLSPSRSGLTFACDRRAIPSVRPQARLTKAASLAASRGDTAVSASVTGRDFSVTAWVSSRRDSFCGGASFGLTCRRCGPVSTIRRPLRRVGPFGTGTGLAISANSSSAAGAATGEVGRDGLGDRRCCLISRRGKQS